MRIACWSGPRNISTALMRSWSSRESTFVSDEPFYAYYLKEKAVKHPMHKEIIEYYPNQYEDIVMSLTSKIPENKEHWYQKHMAHHLIDFENISWIQEFENCILIRHPKDVISSYIKKNNLTHIDELGYSQQYKLIEYLKKNNQKIIVIDSSILLQNPKRILSQWCKNLNIDFSIKMLRWKRGLYSTDGIWGVHWYNNVINTNQFVSFKKKGNNIVSEHQSIYDQALVYYNEMYDMAIK